MATAVSSSMIALGVVAVIAVLAGRKYKTAMRFHLARIDQGSHVVPSRFGQIEFATAGTGEPLLVIHGAGGGFDQVTYAATRLIAAGYQIIAPSRFGYLRSSTPIDPSPENQAAAYVALLDTLGIKNISVIGISAGTLSALYFALHYPERCRTLTLIVPAVATAGTALSPQGRLPEQGWLSRTLTRFILKSDFLFWLGIQVAPKTMIRSVLATDPALMGQAAAKELERAHNILCNILPLSRRTEGLLNDARYTSTPQGVAFDQIAVPTLVVSLEDDYYRTLAPARLIAAKIPGARLVTYSSGGHIWLGHDAELFDTVIAFLRKNTQSLSGRGSDMIRRSA